MILQSIRAVAGRKFSFTEVSPDGLAAASLGVLLTLIFLAHQMLLSVDAMVRALVRRMVTGERLLEWVTAAEEEQGLRRRTLLDLYLDWTPVLAVTLGVLLWWLRGRSVLAALPILLLWAGSKAISLWLDRPLRIQPTKSDRDKMFLRRIALRTWRFFVEFSNAKNGWLIPDHVRESPFVIDRRVSPTNLGLLLNSRQVACQLGYLTLPEFVELTQATLTTFTSLPRYRGHLYNWYDAGTCEPLKPLIVSSVDSGNLVASLWTLEQGAREQLHRPLVGRHLGEGLADHLRELVAAGCLPRRVLWQFLRSSHANWLDAIANFPVDSLPGNCRTFKHPPDSPWFMEQVALRVGSVRTMIRSYTPWLLPQFRPIAEDLPDLGFGPWKDIALEQIPEFCDALQRELVQAPLSTVDEQNRLRRQFRYLLPAARAAAAQLIRDLKKIAERAGDIADQTDFTFLLNRDRRLLAVEFDTETQRLSNWCYDQLASESRLAVFIAIAKDDIPQESWFALGRYHQLTDGRVVLLSWSGTMFEYLMPCLWMHTYPDTLLDRASIEAMRAQHSHAARLGVPWGVSESASSQKLDDGSYKYFAFGLPQLALRDSHPNALVISPYSTFLALHVHSSKALNNISKLCRCGMFGSYGLYESADFSTRKAIWRSRPKLCVPGWHTTRA